MANNAKGILKYRKVQRTLKYGKNAGQAKWYAAAAVDRVVSFEDFISHISDHGSTFSRGTIHGVLTDALDHLQELILDGKSVRLGELGLFSCGMSSRAEDAEADVNAKSVTSVHLIVRNTKTWSNAELAKKCKLEELSDYNTGSTTDDTADTDTADTDTTGDDTRTDTSGSGGSSSGGSSSDDDLGGGMV